MKCFLFLLEICLIQMIKTHNVYSEITVSILAERYPEMQNMLYNMKKSTVYLIFNNKVVPLSPI